MTCATPIAWATLVDYWAGDLDDDASAAVEEHAFGCAACSAASARVASVTEALRAMVPPVLSRAQIAVLRAGGTRVRQNDFAPGDRRAVEFVSDADLLVHRLGGLDLTGAARVDLRITAESTGALISDNAAVPFDPAEGAVFVACQRHYAVFPPDTVMTVSVHASGAPPQTATYTILHTFS